MFATVAFPILHNGAVDVGDHGVSVGNGYMCVDREFRLGMRDQWHSYGNDGTYIEDMKEPVQIRFPPRDFFLVVLGVDESGDRISFALLDDLPPNRRHSSVVRSKTS